MYLIIRWGVLKKVFNEQILDFKPDFEGTRVIYKKIMKLNKILIVPASYITNYRNRKVLPSQKYY